MDIAIIELSLKIVHVTSFIIFSLIGFIISILMLFKN